MSQPWQSLDVEIVEEPCEEKSCYVQQVWTKMRFLWYRFSFPLVCFSVTVVPVLVFLYNCFMADPTPPEQYDILAHPRNYWEALLILIYIFTIFVILTSRKKLYTTAFYYNFVFVGFFDITGAMATFYIRMDNNYKLDESKEIFMRIAASLTATNFVVHLGGQLITIVLQLYAVTQPIRYKDNATLRNIITTMSIVTIFGFAFYLPLFLPWYRFGYKLNNETQRMERGLRVSNMTFYRYCAALFSLFTTIFSIVGMIFLRIKLKTMQLDKKFQQKHIFFWSTFTAVVACALECVYEIFGALGFTSNDAYRYISLYFFGFYFFYFMICNVVTAIITGKQLRREMVRILFKPFASAHQWADDSSSKDANPAQMTKVSSLKIN